MRFRSKRMMEAENAFSQLEMEKFAAYLIYDTTLERDQVIDRFTEVYGEENVDIVMEIIDEEYK